MKSNFNLYIYNSMYGSPLGHGICECGYNGKVQYDNNFSNYCPKCGVAISHKGTALAFDKIPINTKIIHFVNKDKDLYRFKIYISKKEASYNINFEKREIENICVKSKEGHVIDFDCRNKDNMLCYYDMEGNEISEKDFLYIYDNEHICGNYTIFKKEIFGAKIDFSEGYYRDPNSNLYTFKSLIKHLKDIKKWCLIPHNEILIKANLDAFVVPSRFINAEGTDPCSILGLKKYTIKQILKQKQSANIYNTFKHLQDNLNDKLVKYMDVFGSKSPVWLSEPSARLINLINNANLSMDKLYKYVYEEVPKTQYIYDPVEIIRLLDDSYNMTKDLELPFDKKPKALKRYHDTLAREVVIIADKIKERKVKEVINKYKYLEKINTLDDDNKVVKGKEYSIILPKDSQDLVREGKVMHHCVGSYITKMANEKCVILFLRKTDDLDNPFVTIEYSVPYKSIIQIKAFGNSRAPKKAISFIDEWAKENNINIQNYY